MSDEKASLQSINFTGFLGWTEQGRPEKDDLAEAFHEAAKVTASAPPTLGAGLLETDPEVQELITRSVRRNPNLPTVSLPSPSYPDVSIGTTIAQRQSRRQFGPEPVSLQDLSTLLHAAYGVTEGPELPGDSSGSVAWEEGPYVVRPVARSVPSAGALYPLEIYPAVRNVEGLASGLYHYDPLEQALEVIREQDLDDLLRRILLRRPELPDSAGSCGVIFFVTGVFWRTRFKYWLRGYRFALLEAGHLAQNLLLICEALGLGAFPNGGYWDRKVDAFLGVDGVNESVVYSVLAGSTPGAETLDRS
jgi:SagB-type dehydrogenase family enzyme